MLLEKVQVQDTNVRFLATGSSLGSDVDQGKGKRWGRDPDWIVESTGWVNSYGEVRRMRMRRRRKRMGGFEDEGCCCLLETLWLCRSCISTVPVRAFVER